MTHSTREVEDIVAQLLLRTYDRCFVRGRVPPEVGSSIAHYDLFLKEELTNLLHQQLQKARQNLLRELKDEFYEVDVEKVPSIQDEAYANQFESKAEAFWYGEKQGLKALQTIIDRYQNELDQDKQ